MKHSCFRHKLIQAIEAGPKPTYFEVWYSKARLFRWWAEWKINSRQSAEKEIRRGLEIVSKALEMNPRSAEMIGTRGIFLLFQARSLDELSQRKAFADKAQTSLREALKLNANLSNAFMPYLNEAESLAKSK